MQEQVPRADYAQVAQVARRIGGLCREIKSAHDLGHGPGFHDDPWSQSAQREATPIYLESTPASYQLDLANKFEHVARSMSCVASPRGAEEAWFIVDTYLRCAASSIREHCQDLQDPVGIGAAVADLSQPTPSVIRFDQLAGIYSRRGIGTLATAAATVEAACEHDSTAVSPLTAQEREWVLGLIAGKTEAELASTANVGDRTVSRRLATLWQRIGARNRTEGVALCYRRGWLD